MQYKIKLQHIDLEVCPYCKSEPKRITAGMGLNNHYSENTQFKCGHTVTYRENQGISIDFYCTKSPEYKERKARRQAANFAIQALVESINVDEEYKKGVLEYLPT